MEFLFEYGLFLAKAVTFLIVLAVVIGLVAGLAQRPKPKSEGYIETKNLNDYYQGLYDDVESALLDEQAAKDKQKAKEKSDKKALKEKKQAAKKGETPETKKRLFVLDFEGDIRAAETETFKHAVSAVLRVATENDEVVVNLESSGGMVHSYGLAASQLDRIVKRKIPLTITVDKVAASGGYMMACVADKIVAAPFAIIGSIGVMAQLPNFHRLLKKHDIDFECLTAGEYKRTLTVLGENTEKGREKFVNDLENTHELFKSHIQERRAQVDIEAVATGEIWYGREAIEKNLVDEIMTSDEYITQYLDECDVIGVSYASRKSLMQRLGVDVEGSVNRWVMGWVSKLAQQKTWW